MMIGQNITALIANTCMRAFVVYQNKSLRLARAFSSR
jgi:hypothetical protein